MVCIERSYTFRVIVHLGPNYEGWREAVEIVFRGRKMQRECTSERGARRRFGQNAEPLLTRLATLLAADHLGDLIGSPGHLHPLAGDRAGQWALSLQGPHRLIFEIADDPVPTLPDGGIDLTQVSAVRILEVAQYHG